MSYYREVPLEPLRDAFQRSGRSVAEVARAAGMDWTHVNRTVKPTPMVQVKRGRRYGPVVYRTVQYETALRLAEGIGVDPVEVGL